MEPLGKTAYDAWRREMQRALDEGRVVRPEGARLAEWDDLPPVERDAWQVAAEAVL